MGRPKAELTEYLVKSLIDYNPDTGVFTWLKPATRVSAGDVVGSLDAWGYLVTKIRGNVVKLHRLAWFYMTGEWPREIDHINRVKTDNRFSNLRAASEDVQKQNRDVQRNSATGVKGVGYRKSSGKFVARVRSQNKNLFYAEFKTLEEAKAARALAELMHQPYSPLHAAARV